MVNNNRWSIPTASAALLVAAAIPSLNAQENSTPNGIEDDRSGAYTFTNANIYRANGSILNGGTSALITLGDKNANEAIIEPDAAAYYSLDKGTSTQSMPSSLMGSFALLRQTFLDAEWFTSQDPRPFTDDTLDMRTSQLLGAYIQGRDIDLFGTQQQLYERFREKYSKRIE